MTATTIGTIISIFSSSEQQEGDPPVELLVGFVVALLELGAASRVSMVDSYRIITLVTYFVSAKYCSEIVLVDLRLL